jgi:hypothetical protein
MDALLSTRRPFLSMPHTLCSREHRLVSRGHERRAGEHAVAAEKRTFHA